MFAKVAVCLALLAAVAPLFSGILKAAWPSAALLPYPISFRSLAPGVLRQGYLWEARPRRVVDVHVFLVKVNQDYILVDVGAPGEEYEAILSAGLRERVEDGRLRLIMLTHGHIDHVGALTSLVKDYPDVQVLFHQDEAPFLTGTDSYGDIPSDNPDYAVSRFDVSSALPPARVLLVSGETGDIADARGPSGQKPAWVPPKGILTYYHGAGHAPGHLSYLHAPSNSLIAGDIFGNLGQPPKISLPPPMFTPNMTEARLSLLRIRHVNFAKAFCAHDRVEGVNKEQLQKYLDTLQGVELHM